MVGRAPVSVAARGEERVLGTLGVRCGRGRRLLNVGMFGLLQLLWPTRGTIQRVESGEQRMLDRTADTVHRWGGTDQKVEMTGKGGFAGTGAPDEAHVHIAPAQPGAALNKFRSIRTRPSNTTPGEVQWWMAGAGKGGTGSDGQGYCPWRWHETRGTQLQC
jgi:hypothetical protein